MAPKSQATLPLVELPVTFGQVATYVSEIRNQMTKAVQVKYHYFVTSGEHAGQAHLMT